jgi:hypothetical protein
MRYYGFQNEVKSYLNRLQLETTIQISPSIAKALNDRVESLKKSGVWAQYSLGFNDVDGDNYLARANVRDIMGRSEVLWFVRGMKALGLYSNMIAWPLRSYQNTGTGSVAQGFGGLSNNITQTLINSPTWQTTGISCTGTGYTRGNTSTIPTFTNFSVVNACTAIAYNPTIQSQFWSRSETNGLLALTPVTGGSIYMDGTTGSWSGVSVAPINTLGIYQTGINNGFFFLRVNGGAESLSTGGKGFTFSAANIFFGQAYNTRYFTHVQHINMIFNNTKVSSLNLRTLLLNTVLFGIS